MNSQWSFKLPKEISDLHTKENRIKSVQNKKSGTVKAVMVCGAATRPAELPEEWPEERPAELQVFPVELPAERGQLS